MVYVAYQQKLNDSVSGFVVRKDNFADNASARGETGDALSHAKMSRKKGGKGKQGGSTPSSSPGSGKEKSGKGGAGTGAPTQTNGVVHPSRPSLSTSGEFYDLAFKVGTTPGDAMNATP